MVDIDITDNYDSLVVRAVPLVIVVAELLILEVVNDRHQSDRQADTIL